MSNLLSGAGTAPVAGDGSFAAGVAALPGEELSVVVFDPAGNTSPAELFTVTGTLPIPPDPAAVAPALDPTVASDFCTAVSFLWEGASPVQYGVAPGALDCTRAAVLRGRVLDAAGAPLPGVTVRVLDRPDLGAAVTRADGAFDLAVTGGGVVTLVYTLDGYLPVHRGVEAPRGDFARAPDVVLTPLDGQVTAVDLTAATPVQVARGNAVSDADGGRQATLFFLEGTTAALRYPDGTSEPISNLTVRATEYTVGPSGPAAIPAELPRASLYTYAVELSADEATAAGASGVAFSQPVVSYTDNFLSLPTGTAVPVGAYDRARATWEAEADGRVIEILAVTGGLADLDVDGSGTAADAGALAALGITDAERGQLAALYAPGQSLWRVPVSHFTPYDYNFPGRPADGAEVPRLPKPKGGDDDKKPKPCTTGGSIIECENQILGEVVGIAGTPYSLHYRSDRVPGRRIANRLEIPLSGAALPPGLERIDLTVEVAGQSFAQSFGAPAPELGTTFDWDGTDAYGRTLQGRQPYHATVGYVYDAEYQQPDCGGAPCFAQPPGGTPLVPARGEVTLEQTHRGWMGTWSAVEHLRLGGWTLSAHHAYDPREGTLYLGDGRRRSIGDAKVIRTLAGTLPGDGGEGGPAEEAQLLSPARIVLAPPVPSVGSPVGGAGFYISDKGNCKVKLVDGAGVIRTVAGAGCGQGAAYSRAEAESVELHAPTEIELFEVNDIEVDRRGNLYILDRANFYPLEPNPELDWRIYRIDPQGVLHLHWRRPRTDIDVSQLAVDPFLGDLYAGVDGAIARIHEGGVGADAYTVVAGVEFLGGPAGPTFVADRRVPSKASGFSGIRGLEFSSDGELYVSQDSDRILRVSWDGWIEQVAGNVYGNDPGSAPDFYEGPYFSGDGCPVSGRPPVTGCPEEGAWIDVLGGDLSVGPDGGLYLADVGNHRIRRVDTRGIMSTVVGSGPPTAATCAPPGPAGEPRRRRAHRDPGAGV